MTRRVLFLIGANLALVWCAGLCCAQALDTSLHLGFLNSADEAAHQVSVSSGSLSGGSFKLGQSSRVVAPSQEVWFDIAVDPTQQNYLTTRFFSDSTTHTGRLAVGQEPTRGAGLAPISWGQLDDNSSNGMVNNRWHYATVPLPLSSTQGKTSVRLALYGLDNNSNWNITPPSADANTSNTRSIYGVFTHTNSRFEVPDAVNNNPVIAPYDYGNYTKLTANQVASFTSNLISIADGIATQVRNKQKTTAGSDPSLLGGFDVVTNQGSIDANLNATQVAHQNTDNMGPQRGAVILARAYNMQGGAYYQDANTLERVAWGLDFTRRSQGNTGGWWDVHSPVTWLGGGTAQYPNRNSAGIQDEGTGSLEGISHQEMAKAFLLTHTAMENAGLLDQLVDDDNKASTPMIPRRQAYEDLFREIVDFHTGYFGGQPNDPFQPTERGHAPNQDLYQVGGLRWATEALEVLNPTAFDADPTTSHQVAQAQLKSRAYEAAGLTTSPFNNSVWFSPAGLPLECCALKAGGYSSEYGQRQSEDIWEIAQYLDDPADRKPLEGRAADAANLWQNFWYPIYNAEGTIDTRIEGAINWRNSKINGAGEQWFPAQFAALSENGIEDPSVIRALQLAYMNGELHISAPRGGHFWQDSVWIMEQVDSLEALLTELPSTADLPADSQRLPWEAGQGDFAWIDGFGGAVAFRHNDDFIYMALNWKHGSTGNDPAINNIVRVHEITPEDGRVVTAMMESPTGNFGELYRVEYGDYLVGVNADDATSYLLDVPSGDGFLPDLVSGGLLQITAGRLMLSPGQSVVLLLDELSPLLDSADFDGDGDVDGRDFLIWQRNSGVAGGTFYGPGDANGDGDVNQLDLGVWQTQFGSVALSTGTVTVPEPGAFAFLFSSVVFLGTQRCRTSFFQFFS